MDSDDLNKRENLIPHLFILAKKKSKNSVLIVFLLSIILGIISYIFPEFIGEEKGNRLAAALSAFAFCNLFSIGILIEGIFSKRKVNNIINHYYLNPNARIWAEGQGENTLLLIVDKKKLSIPVIFLPFSIEKCCSVINQNESFNDGI